MSEANDKLERTDKQKDKETLRLSDKHWTCSKTDGLKISRMSAIQHNYNFLVRSDDIII